MNTDYITWWSKETLSYNIGKEILSNNKTEIFELLNEFKESNPNVDFYIAGSSALILQDQIAKRIIKDIDIYCPNQDGIVTDKIDLIKNDIFPLGWRDRVANINGYKVISVFDVTCTMTCCFLKPTNLFRETLLIWLLRDLNLEEVKNAVRKKIQTGIGVTDWDHICFYEFERKFKPRLIEMNMNPQEELVKQLQEEENKNTSSE